ncbi:MAG: carbon-nitrogen hydrolase family protein [Planctomycetota bacterium]|jgi:predicted amidohydrolase
MRSAALLFCLTAACSGPKHVIRMVEEAPPHAESARVAVLHLAAQKGDRSTPEAARRVLDHNYRRAERLIRLAAGAGAEIIVTPEYVNSGNWILGDLRARVASQVPEPPTREPLWEIDDERIQPYLRRYARLSAELRCYVVAHTIERTEADGDLRYYNTMVAFDPRGRVVARYRKHNLWLYENFAASRGRQTACLDTPHGRFGLLICLDAIIPWTVLKTMSRHDIDFFIVTSNWQHTPLPGRTACNLLADLTGLPVAWSNQAHGGLAGGAGIIRPWARDRTIGMWGPEGVVVANLPLPERLRGNARLAPGPGCPVLATR